MKRNAKRKKVQKLACFLELHGIKGDTVDIEPDVQCQPGICRYYAIRHLLFALLELVKSSRKSVSIVLISGSRRQRGVNDSVRVCTT